jgi:hypothetical protein
LDLTLLEPESDFLLGALDRVGTVADVAAQIDTVIATDGTWGGGERVGGTKEDWKCQTVRRWRVSGVPTTASLDGITSLPDHSADRSRSHIYYTLDV